MAVGLSHQRRDASTARALQGHTQTWMCVGGRGGGKGIIFTMIRDQGAGSRFGLQENQLEYEVDNEIQTGSIHGFLKI